MVLKPQDVYIALKILASGAKRPPYSRLAADLMMSPSEVHASVNRARAANLLHGPELNDRPNLTGLEEFLVHGLKYVFPPERGEPTRGIPTSYAAEPLRRFFARGDEFPPVWPFAEGRQRGIAFEPLYKTAPKAAMRDPRFYEYLALRGGRARERKLAEAELRKRLSEAQA